jgi:NitT/TauT family transport system substrate-binding protein
VTAIHIRATRHSAFYSPLLITALGGFLEEEGLEPGYAQLGPGETAASVLRDGSAHVCQSAVAASWRILEAGHKANFLHFAQINARDGFFIAGREPEPGFTWAGLAGRRVIVDHGAQPLAMFKYAARREGLAFESIEAVDAGDIGGMIAAFHAGKGDYVHLQGPAPQEMELARTGHVVARVGEAFGPLAFSSICATPEWLETDMARAFLRAYRRALQFIVSSPAAEVADMVAPLFEDTGREALTRCIAAYQHLGNWRTDPSIKPDEYMVTVDVFEALGSFSQHYAYEDVVAPPPDETIA